MPCNYTTNIYKVSIMQKIPVKKEVIKAWEAEAKISTVAALCAEANINYRTYKAAVSERKAKQYVQDIITGAVLRLRERRSKLENQLLSA